MKHIRLSGSLGLMIGVVNRTSAPKALETEADFTGFGTEIHSIVKVLLLI